MSMGSSNCVDPAGRGSLHISSAQPHAPSDFDAGLLSHPADLPVHIWAYKLYVDSLPTIRFSPSSNAAPLK